MEEVATAPVEQSIADAHAEHDIDVKLRRAAERTRARAAATGQPEPIRDITARILEMQKHAVSDADAAEHERAPMEPVQSIPREIPPEVRASIVPARFTLASFANYEPANASQKMALRTAARWVECARAREGPMLALIGLTGTGKSHLLYAAVNALLGPHYPIGCYARPWYRLADELRYGGKSPFAPKTALEAFEVRALLWEQRVVLLDEVRPTASTAFDDTELAKFACWAYDARLAVFITSNVSPLADVMGPPAASRFSQVIVEGPDRRQS